jgi:hypothetical protein
MLSFRKIALIGQNPHDTQRKQHTDGKQDCHEFFIFFDGIPHPKTKIHTTPPKKEDSPSTVFFGIPLL